MMASTRFVLLRNLDKLAPAEQDAIAAYIEAPSPSTCFVVTATKLDGRTKLPRVAKKAGVLYAADPPKGAAIAQFASQEARSRGHAMDAIAVQALVDAIGEDLSAIDDAIERLSLFVGAGKPIDLVSVEACVTRVRADTIWALVDAVSGRQEGRALTAVASLLAEREPPLRVLAMLARQLRMLAKMREALARGLRGADAAVAAGAPPFKADELSRAARGFGPDALDRAFQAIARTDRNLKGSKVPDDVVLVRTVSELCRV
jgi:DNA polymerase-3 subunit delta